MFIVLHARRCLKILCLTILVIGGMLMVSNRTLVPVFSQGQNQALPVCYVIDAGHGGEDGGAVSPDGIVESSLNLGIAQRLNGLMMFLGQETIMTRSGEEAVYSSDAQTLREKKRSDLHNRAAMINRQPNAVLVSIHQNSLPKATQVRGAQVFYNTVEDAQTLAQCVQSTLNETVNSAQPKEAKAIDASIYLMRQVQCPAILVECGFLSNTEETRMLQDYNYQKKLAAVIAAGVLNHADNRNGANKNESEDELLLHGVRQ